MISFPLFKRNIIVGVKLFVIIFAVMCLYTCVIIYMFNPELADMLNDYQKALPEMMAAVGMTGVASSLLEWIHIYLYGFIMMLFPLVFTIILVNKMVMGYIDRGSMSSLLATPNSRRKIIITQALSIIFWIFILMIAISAVGILSCELMFPGKLDFKGYILLNTGTLILQLAIAGITFVSACLFSDSKNYYLLGAGVPVLFFLFKMMANMGEKLEFLKYMTIYTLFPSDQIIKLEGNYIIYEVILFLIAAALFIGGTEYFKRRDLCL